MMILRYPIRKGNKRQTRSNNIHNEGPFCSYVVALILTSKCIFRSLLQCTAYNHIITSEQLVWVKLPHYLRHSHLHSPHKHGRFDPNLHIEPAPGVSKHPLGAMLTLSTLLSTCIGIIGDWHAIKQMKTCHSKVKWSCYKIVYTYVTDRLCIASNCSWFKTDLSE